VTGGPGYLEGTRAVAAHGFGLPSRLWSRNDIPAVDRPDGPQAPGQVELPEQIAFFVVGGPAVRVLSKL